MNSATLRSHIDVRLIEKALAITGKTLNYTQDSGDYLGPPLDMFFSIEKFGWYLLSDSFLEEYKRLPSHDNHIKDYEYNWNLYDWISEFGKAINFYQSGNEKPLISLLEKI